MSQLAAQLALLPDALAGHLAITTIPLAIGVAISVPLGVLAARRPALRTALLGFAGVAQTIPGLALLALMVPVLVAVGRLLAPLGVDVPALGALPVGLALAIYAMLPVLRNTVVGLEGVPADVVEAARAIGMTPAQVRRHVELPLAAPVVLAGIRTAAVWVVGLGTLATPVGATSLGSFIFSGLQTRNPTAVLVGCVGAAGLALLVDGALAAVERAVARRRPGLAAAALGLVAALVGAAIVVPRTSSDGRPRVVVGGKPFTEQYVLVRAIEVLLDDAGFSVERRDSLGSTILLDGLLAGEVDVGVDYSGTLWAHHLGRSGAADVETVLAEVCAALGRDGVGCVGPLGFENAYALAVRAADAEARGWRTIADLAPDAPGLRVGADYEFLQRTEWAAVRAAYGLTFRAEVTYDPTFLYEAVAKGEVDAISAYTSDGRVLAYDLRVLDDPRGALPPYDAVLLVADDAPPGVADALRPLVRAVSVERMREANRLVDVEGRTPDEAAAWLVREAREP